MRSAVMIGAGKIGRAFLARLMRASGYRVVFIDKDDDTVEKLRAFKEYPVTVVRPEGIEVESVGGYEAYHISKSEEIEKAVGDAALIAVSVGVENVADVAGYLAPALSKRIKGNAAPVNILVCENMIGSNKTLSDAVRALWEPAAAKAAEGLIGFNSVCVGCTAPLPPERLLREHPLSLVIDAYEELPIAADSICGELPPLKGSKVYEHFDYCIRRKLYIHNMGHAVAAYAGHVKGYTQLSLAMEDAGILSLVGGAMREAARALKKAYPFAEGLEEYIRGLLALFANADMGDTLTRIGRDPMRKTSRDDRLAGALRFCFDQGQDAPCIAAGLAAAFCFEAEGDSKAAEMRELIISRGIDAFVQEHCGLTRGQALPVLAAYEMMKCVGNGGTPARPPQEEDVQLYG